MADASLRAAIANWKTTFKASVKPHPEYPATAAAAYFRCLFSKPTKARPVAPAYVVLDAVVEARSGAIHVQLESESKAVPEAEFARGAEAAISKVLATKLAAFGSAGAPPPERWVASRLPSSYAPETGASGEADEGLVVTSIAAAEAAATASEAAETKAAETAEASAKIQALARGRKARKRVSRIKRERDSAVKMQALARGFHARREVAAVRSSARPDARDAGAAAPAPPAAEAPAAADEDGRAMTEEDGAVQMQRVMRGRIARKEVEAMRAQRARERAARESEQ